jgi:putative dehydrogenase
MMVREDYGDATMKIEVCEKDMYIIGEFATKLDCPTPLLVTCAPIYTAAIASGRAKEYTGAVYAVLYEMAGLRGGHPGGRRGTR